MTRPRIGITTSYENQRQEVGWPYLHAIEAAGGLPLIVPMLTDQEAIAEFAELLDGLVITGGPGITQGLIGTLPPDLPPAEAVRVTADTQIYKAFADRPVLGICYGMQFINAQASGTIYADVHTQQSGALLHSAGRGGQEHPVRFTPGSRLYDLLGAELTVNTYHIQAVAETGVGLRAVGYGPDGVIEALESEDGRLMGLQFHPERMFEQTRPLFEDFVQRCR